MKRQSIIPPGTEALYDGFHFAPATRVGDIIWVSGQVGLDAQMKPGVGMEAQATLAFGYLKYVLEQAGSTLADVVELTTFHTELRRDVQGEKNKKTWVLDRRPSLKTVSP